MLAPGTAAVVSVEYVVRSAVAAPLYGEGVGVPPEKNPLHALPAAANPCLPCDKLAFGTATITSVENVTLQVEVDTLAGKGTEPPAKNPLHAFPAAAIQYLVEGNPGVIAEVVSVE